MKYLLIILLLTSCGSLDRSAIDKGINAANERGKCKGYQTTSDYNIDAVKGEMRNGVPVFKVKMSGYANTDYDQGGYVYAAGQFVPPNTIRVPDIATGDQLALAVEYEVEHAILYANDKAEYHRTFYHIDGGHPIISCP